MIVLFERLFELLSTDSDPKKAWKGVIKENDFAFLVSDEQEQREETEKGKPHSKFKSGAKSAAFLAMELPKVSTCRLCGGLIHRNGVVADHIEERFRGGTSASKNAAWVHPACNSNRRKKGEVAKKK